MLKTLRPLLVLVSLAVPATAIAATIDASLIPDGTYTVKVEKVIDAQHVQVAMDNGSETTLASGRPSVTFASVKPNDSIKCSVIKGAVVVYKDLST